MAQAPEDNNRTQVPICTSRRAIEFRVCMVIYCCCWLEAMRGVLVRQRERLQAFFQTRPARKERQTLFFQSPPHRFDTHLHGTVDKSTTRSHELLVQVGTIVCFSAIHTKKGQTHVDPADRSNHCTYCILTNTSCTLGAGGPHTFIAPRPPHVRSCIFLVKVDKNTS